jgi:hypothetical protein
MDMHPAKLFELSKADKIAGTQALENTRISSPLLRPRAKSR